jgi:two-component system, NtrC family, response regulator AtoC
LHQEFRPPKRGLRRIEFFCVGRTLSIQRMYQNRARRKEPMAKSQQWLFAQNSPGAAQSKHPCQPTTFAIHSENHSTGNPAHLEQIEQLDSRHAFIAVSPAMREVRKQVELVAGIDVPVLLLGESGTGKEVVARLIHKLSTRAQQRFLKVNCAALPVELLESEMFGYEAGAFTGAHQSKAGKFETCHRGTILLDEIAEMPISPQAKLLHVLQDGEFSRLGSTSTVHVDVRVLAATNTNVRQAVHSGTFRTDLYYRLNVFMIALPPLREHKEDLSYLLNHFMDTWAACYGRPRLPVTRRILDACASYPWPGNVRELESFVKRYLVLGDEDQTLDLLERERDMARGKQDPVFVPPPADCSNLKSRVLEMKSDAERSAILKALEQANGSKQGTARLLGISLRTVHYKIRRYGIESYYRTATSCVGAKVPPATEHPAIQNKRMPA